MRSVKAQELSTLIARIELKSQMPAAPLEPSIRDTSDDIGGRRPSGGIDRQDDREPESLLKSADHFRRRAARAMTESQLDAIIADARRTLDAWERQPIQVGQPPRPDEPQFKRWVAESPLDSKELARLFHMSSRRINQIRQAYRDAA